MRLFGNILTIFLILSVLVSGCGIENYPEFLKPLVEEQIKSTESELSQPSQEGGTSDHAEVTNNIWVLNAADNKLIQINTDKGIIASIITLEAKTGEVSFYNDSIWVTDIGENAVLRIDPQSKEIVDQYYIMQGKVRCLETNDYGVWVGISLPPGNPPSPEKGGIVKINPESKEIVEVIQTTGMPVEIKTLDNTLWVLQEIASHTIFDRINLSSLEITPLPQVAETDEYIHYFAGFTILDGTIWAVPASPFSRFVFIIDPTDGKVTQHIEIGSDEDEIPVDVTTHNTLIWIALKNGTIVILDPITHKVISRKNISESLTRFISQNDEIWAVSVNEAKIFKVTDKTLNIQSELSLGNTPLPTPSATPRFRRVDEEGFICKGAEPPGLSVGARAKVKENPPLPNRVRIEPYNDTQILGEIEPGETMIILEGPVCSSGWAWWKVRAEKDGLVGWTSEGDEESTWLELVP